MMKDSTEYLYVRVIGNTVVAKVLGESSLYKQEQIEEIARILNELLTQGSTQHLIVNLEPIDYAATEMIAKLVSLNRKAQSKRVRLSLCGLGPALTESIKILAIDRVFQVFQNETEALGSAVTDSGNPTQDHKI